jgi:GNAT superfamily N-acetyltransferase
MTEADLPLGMRLVEQAGWNQVEADWSRFLALQPDGGLVAEYEGVPCATLTTCRFGPVAWIAMLLVEADRRGRGLGRALMDRALDQLASRGVRTVRLDATPLGQPLYESLGFAVDFPLARYQGILSAPSGPPTPEIVPFRPDHESSLLDLDFSASGTSREKLIRRLLSEFPDSARVAITAGRVAGFLLSRPGRLASYLGPLIAEPAAGDILLVDACRRLAGRAVFLDIPIDHTPARSLVEGLGLAAQRPLLRMSLGEPVRPSHPDRLWASAGPEMG